MIGQLNGLEIITTKGKWKAHPPRVAGRFFSLYLLSKDVFVTERNFYLPENWKALNKSILAWSRRVTVLV